MDVRCDRCSTEYEFDDALVSERGTSVKCTNCGHQFKVYRARSGALPDQWVVVADGGKQLNFGSLRELQKAILAGTVKRTDRLARAGGSPRPLHAIPELQPFFDDAETTVVAGAPARPRMPTPQGLGAPPDAAHLRTDASTAGSIVVPLPLRATMPERQLSMREILDADPPTVPVAPLGRDSEPEPATRRRAPPQEAPDGLYTPSPGDVSTSSDFHDTDEVVYSRPQRAGAMRWVVAVVMLGTLGVLGATVGRRWLEEHGGAGAPKGAASSDARVDDLVALGERALADGDLEGAKESLIRASALADKDKRVLVDLARLAAANADVPWLRLRLLPESAKDARAVAKRELDDAAGRARKAADRAAEVAPDDPSTVRVKIDALRLLDDRAVARSLAPRVSGASLSPETAYVLAALDLAEAEPAWATVIERLRLAASAETSPGRARVALAYALARSGDSAGARAELDRIAQASRPSSLLPDLRAFVGAASPIVDAGVRDAAPDAKAVDVAALPAVGAPGAVAGAAPPAAAGGTPRGGDDVGEFSERELQKRLFGDHPPAATTTNAPPPAKKKNPDIDTSDLPGVTPP
jgi:predicted Zn finger-like uncharacterized protein